MEQVKFELRPGDGTLYKFFDEFRLLRADVRSEVRVNVYDLVDAHHPDAEIGPLRYCVQRVYQHPATGLWCFQARLTGEKPQWARRPTPRTHDYTREALGVGHSFEVLEIRADGSSYLMGWGHGLHEGDLVCISTPVQKTLVVDWVEYSGDPPDLWRGVFKEKKDG